MSPSIFSFRPETPPNRIASPARRSELRRGITLMEVLISMFVLLFGLMGVAAIFPVGNHYVVQGEKFDRGNALADNAFQEIRTRGMLAPETWVYSDPNRVIANNDTFNYAGPGHAFVIDPMSTADVIRTVKRTGNTSPLNSLDLWPKFNQSGVVWPDSDRNNPWRIDSSSIWSQFPFRNTVGTDWPVRRVSLYDPVETVKTGSIRPMSLEVAESIFRLQDDLSVELPERDDNAGILRWQVDQNGTPQDPTDDTLLTRQYKGNFSWMATVLPLTTNGLAALQPVNRETHPYEVSVVVFYKRVNTPLPETERMMRAELLTGGELVMYGGTQEEVDPKFENVKAGDWVAVMGVNETTGAFMLKWYRMLALDEEAYTDGLPSDSGVRVPLRRAMLQGPDWHFPVDPSTGFSEPLVTNLRVAIFPGIASVVTREMELTQPLEYREIP